MRNKLFGLLALALVVFMVSLFGSGAYATTGAAGTSLMGVYTTDNVAAFTITGFCNAFGTCGTPQFTLNGSSSGGTVVQATAAASGTLTLPAATDTLVGRNTTDTLTNKTLTAPVINNAVSAGPVPVACGASCTLGNANLKGMTLLNQAAGSVATLPGATGTGNSYKLVVTVLTTSGSEKVLTNPTTDTIIGTAQGENAGTAKVFVGNASTYHSIQMPFAGTQPQGGFIGDEIECTDIATGIWECNIMYQAGTTPTTPYSASTS